MKFNYLLTITTLLTLMLASCVEIEHDGIEDSIEFTAENANPENIKIMMPEGRGIIKLEVNYDGGGIDFIAANKPWIRICYAQDENDQYLDVEIVNSIHKTVHGEWFDISCEKNVVHFVFTKRPISAQSEKIMICIGAGNTSKDFEIKSYN